MCFGKKQPKIIHMCLDFGGQNHLSKAVIKMTPIAFIASILSPYLIMIYA